MDEVYFSWETGFVKPNLEAYNNLLRLNSLNANSVIYFDDVEENIAAAESIGIKSYKYNGLEETKKVIENLL